MIAKRIPLGIPGLISGGITQINIVVGTVIASLQAGAVSYLYYADRLYQLPLGIVGIAIGVVLLPELARQLRAGRIDQAMDTVIAVAKHLTPDLGGTARTAGMSDAVAAAI